MKREPEGAFGSTAATVAWLQAHNDREKAVDAIRRLWSASLSELSAAAPTIERVDGTVQEGGAWIAVDLSDGTTLLQQAPLDHGAVHGDGRSDLIIPPIVKRILTTAPRLHFADHEVELTSWVHYQQPMAEVHHWWKGRTGVCLVAGTNERRPYDPSRFAIELATTATGDLYFTDIDGGVFYQLHETSQTWKCLCTLEEFIATWFATRGENGNPWGSWETHALEADWEE